MRRHEGALRALIREMVQDQQEISSEDTAITFIDAPAGGRTYIVAYSISTLGRAIGEQPRQFDPVIAAVLISPPRHFGPCNGAWRVEMSASSRRGWGTAAYLAALDALGQMSPDRVSVSEKAQGLWRSLKRNGYVSDHPFDDIDDPKTPPPEDDCQIFRGQDEIINASYKLIKPIPDEVKSAIDRGKGHMEVLKTMDEDFGGDTYAQAVSLMKNKCTALFNRLI